MSNLIDVWFTEVQLYEIITALNYRLNFLEDENKRDEIRSIISHLEHCLQKINTKQWDENV